MAFVVIATWKAKPGQAERIRDILRTVAPLNRREEKSLEFQAHVSAEDPDTFVLYEKYVDASGYDDHKAGEPFRKYVLGEAIPNLADRSVTTLETLD
ncbi:antibiotic biosynthesis monooxygenase [Amycolatopsis rubida]|uniref:Antibiotic biosynthesis monooxygenase n=1 Tax=Amycolatopsis rubida TaxID=112413 RepID=A0A1I5NBY6_9PSEU|nr:MULTISPECIES: putative quinol monooxygenase [Amycolatopsis]MYW92884.1 antibiotic biosynthesis monooxygenase [Amycolatopsis rubida]NEC57871.1 antibiotic biosynthesis monooxygenase [Amycolatopsis rubida]OAP21604.1 Antibiotic biosynthesis monooxygenase [Amycolatopsis sp. M39]SFP19365.1 Quinol monooxygenase YgiN [Amycolatopsis rubida]